MLTWKRINYFSFPEPRDPDYRTQESVYFSASVDGFEIAYVSVDRKGVKVWFNRPRFVDFDADEFARQLLDVIEVATIMRRMLEDKQVFLAYSPSFVKEIENA